MPPATLPGKFTDFQEKSTPNLLQLPPRPRPCAQKSAGGRAEPGWGGPPSPGSCPGPRPGLLSSPPLLRWPEPARPGQMAHPGEAGAPQREPLLWAGGGGFGGPVDRGGGHRLAPRRPPGVGAGPGSPCSRHQATGHTAGTQLWQGGEPATWRWGGQASSKVAGTRTRTAREDAPSAPARDAALCAD